MSTDDIDIATASIDELRAIVQETMVGVNRYVLKSACRGILRRYNPQNIETLETFVERQIETNEYDSASNLTLLKLYQLSPFK